MKYGCGGLLTRVVSDQVFPLELKVPNAATRSAMNKKPHRVATAGFASPFNQSLAGLRLPQFDQNMWTMPAE